MRRSTIHDRPFPSCLWLLFQNKALWDSSFSDENEFVLHVNENSFSYERLCTRPHFENEAQDNSEMA